MVDSLIMLWRLEGHCNSGSLRAGVWSWAPYYREAERIMIILDQLSLGIEKLLQATIYK